MLHEADDYNINEGELNWFGNGLLRMNKKNEAIEIFKLNVKEHPDSWQVYDNLGYAYDKNNQIDLAIKNYKKSIELNPKNDWTINRLKELHKKNN